MSVEEKGRNAAAIAYAKLRGVSVADEVDQRLFAGDAMKVVEAYLAATSPAGDLEPVAWRADHMVEGEYTRKFTAIRRVAEIWTEQGLNVTPLYAQALRHQSTGVTGWRSMDSAPKDGTRFLAYGSYDYPGDAAPTEYFEVAAYSGDDEWPWETGEGLHKAEFFSHWQPITHPTAALSAQERG